MKKKVTKKTGPDGIKVTPAVPLATFICPKCGNGAMLSRIVGGYLVRNLEEGGTKIDSSFPLNEKEIAELKPFLRKCECAARLKQDIEARFCELFLDVLDDRHDPKSIEAEFNYLIEKSETLDRRRTRLGHEWKKIFDRKCAEMAAKQQKKAKK